MNRLLDSATPERDGRPDSGPADERSGTEQPSPKRRKLEKEKSDCNKTTATRRKTACQSCRMRKVKCDAVRPTCGICKASASVCEYTDPLPEKLTLDSATELLCAKLDRMQQELEKLHGNPQRDTRGEIVTNGHTNGDTNGHHDTRRDPDRPRQPSGTVYSVEPSKDFLQIPPHRTTADTVLNWEIFEGKYPYMALIGVFFTPVDDPSAPDAGPGQDSIAVSGGLIPPNEEQIPLLVDNFLQNVHTKNPVLDVEQLVKQARIIANNGLGWDAWSCLVLLAAALGTIARPFHATVNVTSNPAIDGGTTAVWIADTPSSPKELQQAESCFVLACRRLGGLKHTILGSHCYFFAGVYLMYTLRPLLSWQYFIQSSNIYQLYMKRTHCLAADITHLGHLPIHYNELLSSKQRRLEESMYWSCFKSESEFRVELPLPQSEIASYSHPQMFPSPPSPAGLEKERDYQGHDSDDGYYVDPSLPGLTRSNTSSSYTNEAVDLRQHTKRLCHEEESWYYYLTEIALRRIGNRIINTFFGVDHASWMDIRPLLGIALEFDTQVSAWSAHLPAAMQHWETNYTIRAPTLVQFQDETGDPVSRELSWATDNRLLEMRSWLFQPFLYYFIHNGSGLRQPRRSHGQLDSFSPPMPNRDDFVNAAYYGTQSFSAEDAAALYHFITSGIELNLKIIDVRSLRHRHHGLWYDLRSLMTASLILLAIVKNGQEAWIPGGAEVLWGYTSQAHPHEHPIAGKLGHVLEEFSFWSDESPDLRRHRDVLEDVTRTVQAGWAQRKHG